MSAVTECLAAVELIVASDTDQREATLLGHVEHGDKVPDVDAIICQQRHREEVCRVIGEKMFSESRGVRCKVDGIRFEQCVEDGAVTASLISEPREDIIVTACRLFNYRRIEIEDSDGKLLFAGNRGEPEAVWFVAHES